MTDLNFNIFNQRSMMDYINLFPKKEPLLIEKVFKIRKDHNNSNIVDYRVIEKSNAIATFVSEDSMQPAQVRSGRQVAKSFEIPRTWESKIFPVNDLKNINEIGNVYGSAEAKALAEQEYIASELEEFNDRITSLYELCGAQAISSGKIDTSIDMLNSKFDFVFDFGFTESNFVSAKAKWDATGANPITDIRNARTRIRQATGLSADIILMGSEVARAFLANKEVRETLNASNFRIGAIEGNIPGTAGGIQIATQFEGCQIFEYDQTFIDAKGKETSIFPTNGISVIASSSKGNIMHRGVIERIDPQTRVSRKYIDQYYINSNVDRYNTTLELECESRRIPMIHQAGAITNITGAI